MTLPLFTLEGDIETLRAGVTIPARGAGLVLTCNFPRTSLLRPEGSDQVYRIDPVAVITDDSGRFSVQLLAQDDSLGLDVPIQWQVRFADLAPWWFDAPGAASVDFTAAGSDNSLGWGSIAIPLLP